MNDRRRIWILYAIGVALVLGALAWASASVYRLERRNDENLARAQRQQTVRLALWRMDARLAPMLAIESSKPPGSGRAGTLPILGAFTIHADGSIESTNDTALAIARRLRASLGQPAIDRFTDGRAGPEPGSGPPDAHTPAAPGGPGRSGEEDSDYLAREQIASPTGLAAIPPAAPGDERGAAAPGVASTPAIEPRWVAATPGDDPSLVLVRRGDAAASGVVVDWAALRTDLLALVEDLLPGSSLAPIAVGGAPGPGPRLATLPVSFTPGGAIALPPDRWTPALIAILITWVAAVGATVAVGLVLYAVLNLSERRGRFVTAVTHELRTPLTTFRLYAQMLADGMVTDESVRREYLDTLRRESDRLTGIVENVLEYARLARRRGAPRPASGERPISAGELMGRLVPPASRRAEESGLDLVVSDELGAGRDRTLTLDPHAVERVVLNLVDNACKYAAPDRDDEERDTRIHLDARIDAGALTLLVADHGPGIPPRERRRIFGEFRRGSDRRTRDRAGLGLGLALSRGLAREMGGDLTLVRRRGHGAEFELRIELDTP